MKKRPRKLAILIVGEYRSFQQCRRTMLFLDQPDIDTDIYIHTWSRTNTVNSVGRFDSESYVEPMYRALSQEDIMADLGIANCTVSMEERPEIHPLPPIIHGWLSGFDMIRSNSIDYDFVLVMRPDLFFQDGAYFTDTKFRDFKEYKNKHKLGVRLPGKMAPNQLDDTYFFSAYSVMDKLLSNQLSKFYTTSYGQEDHAPTWHRFWYDYVSVIHNLSITNIPIRSEGIIARYPVNESSTFLEMRKLYYKIFRENN
jgi:hypothetical protein